jgi:hypothetical protein
MYPTGSLDPGVSWLFESIIGSILWGTIGIWLASNDSFLAKRQLRNKGWEHHGEIEAPDKNIALLLADTKLTSEQELVQIIKKLKSNARADVAGQVGGTVAGAAGGAAAAGVVASAAGTSTILGSTVLGSALGGIFVASTPVGWIVGCAIAGAAGVYALSRITRSGGRTEQFREELRERLSAKLELLKSQRGHQSHPNFSPQSNECGDIIRKSQSEAISSSEKVVKSAKMIRETFGSSAMKLGRFLTRKP